MKSWVAVAAVVGATTCGDNPIGPSSEFLPDVAGHYTGPIELYAPSSGIDATGRGRVDVTQYGSDVTVTGDITFFGITERLPAITGTLDREGRFTPTNGRSSIAVAAADCGRLSSLASDFSFVGGTLDFQESADTAACGYVELSGMLTRVAFGS